MAAGERGEHQIARVRLSRVYINLSAAFDHSHDLVHIPEVQLRVDALAVQIHRHYHDVHIACALAVAQQGSLDAVRAGHDGQFGGSHSTATVVVGMQAHDHRVAIVHMPAEPLDLIGIYIGCCHLHSGGQIEDHFVLRRRLPHVCNGIADFHGELRLGTREALGRILECPLGLGRQVGTALHFFRAIHRNRLDAGLVQLEDLLALHHRGGVVHMQNRLLDALQ